MKSWQLGLQRAWEWAVPEPVYDFWCEELGLIHRRSQAIGRVVSVQKETHDTVSLWIQPNRQFAGVQPGQHVNLGVRIDGHYAARSYSVSALQGRRFRITARKVANGKVSQYLNERAQVGMTVDIGEVYGEVTAQQFDDKPALFLAGGIGITPIQSMIESWSNSVRQQPVHLVYWGRKVADLAFVDRLKRLAKDRPWFELSIIETDHGERNADGSPKLIDEASAWLDRLKQQLPDFHAFACGQDGFVEQIRQTLSPMVAQFHAESFTPLAAAVPSGQLINVSLTEQRRTVQVPVGANLLSALEQAGVRVASGCRRGTCNTCSCTKKEGLARHLVNHRLSNAHDAGFKPCAHTALSDLTLEL